jgi:hypothetical protein
MFSNCVKWQTTNNFEDFCHFAASGDVYSYAILLQQIILRTTPYSVSEMDVNLSAGSSSSFTNQGIVEEIVFEVQRRCENPAIFPKSKGQLLFKVKEGGIPPMRPNVPRSACSIELYQLMEDCWLEFFLARPTFSKIKDIVRKIVGRGAGNMIDYLLDRMEQYANNLEDQVTKKTQQFMEEKARSEELLAELLPKYETPDAVFYTLRGFPRGSFLCLEGSPEAVSYALRVPQRQFSTP